MSDLLYPQDLTIRVKFQQQVVHPTTGAWVTEPVTGRTDGLVWLSLTRDGAAIHANLSLALTAVGSTPYYTATFDGPTMGTRLAAYPSGTPIWEVVQFGNDAPVVKPWVWRPTRAEV
jgi:hypothetical protein